ncbi:hypothetical protein [Microbacterium resistens]
MARFRRALLVALCGLVVVLSGCSVLGIPEGLDEDRLAAISSQVSAAQGGLDATLHGETKTCEGLCQRISVDLVPRVPDYTAVDIALAIYETDTALEEQRISAFDYCFRSNAWSLADAQYLDARLLEIPALGYGDFSRDEADSRPSYDCSSFAAIDARERLAAFLADRGVDGF